MMAQNDLVVAGIDIAKDKVDVCIRALSQRQTFPSTAEGRRQLISWLRKHKVTKAVMEASGGYEREWAKALREKDMEVRIVDPKRVRHFAQSAGRLAKNDAIDADTIAWFAETFGEVPGQAYDAVREKLQQMVNARQGLLDIKTMLNNKGEQDLPEPVQKMHARLLKKIAVDFNCALRHVEASSVPFAGGLKVRYENRWPKSCPTPVPESPSRQRRRNRDSEGIELVDVMPAAVTCSVYPTAGLNNSSPVKVATPCTAESVSVPASPLPPGLLPSGTVIRPL